MGIEMPVTTREAVPITGFERRSATYGYSPYVDRITGTWIEYDAISGWYDTGLKAQPEDGKDGVGIASVRMNDDYTMTFTFTNGHEYTTPSLRGKDGYTPVKGVDYFDGKDGYTPIKGVDYFDGRDGYTPQKGIDYRDGIDGRDGADGRDGLPGADGHTPEKGVDYFTEADIDDVAAQAARKVTPYDDSEIKGELSNLKEDVGDTESRLSESITEISKAIFLKKTLL